MKSLQLENVSSGYDKKTVIHTCTFEVLPQETLVLMGPSGSGKTTLIRTILGSLPLFSGYMRLNGEDLSRLPMEKRAIGYLPQDYGLFPHLNVGDNIAFGLRVRGVSKEKQRSVIENMLQLVHLPGYAERKIQELSGGEKQRVGLARALAIEPHLLLLDEPLSSIDQVTKAEVAFGLKELFQRLSIPIILVTHNTEDASFLAEKLAIMINGTIEQIGSPREVEAHPKTDYIKRLLHPFGD